MLKGWKTWVSGWKEALKEPEPEDQEESIEDENIEIKRALLVTNEGEDFCGGEG